MICLCWQYTENKSFAEDLTEGKFGFPVIHAVQTQKHDKQVLRKLIMFELLNTLQYLILFSSARYIKATNTRYWSKKVLYTFTREIGKL